MLFSVKRMSFMLAFVMIWTLILNTVIYADVHYQAGDIIYSEDFSSALDDSWNTYSSTSSTVWGSVGVSGGELLLKYTSAGRLRNLFANRVVSGTDCDEVSFEFDFKINNSNKNVVKSIAFCSQDGEGVMMLDGKDVAKYNDSVYIIVYNSEFYYVDGADDTLKKLSEVQYIDGARYYFKANINNINDSYDLYLSTTKITDTTAPVKKNVPLAFSTDTEPSAMKYCFRKYATESAVAQMYIDNIKVSCVSDNFYSRLDLENELKSIKPYVESGDYETANSMLLSHYREKSSPVSDEALGKRDDVGANLIKNKFMYNSVSYAGEMNFSNRYAYSYLDLSSKIKSAGEYNLELVAYNTTSPVIEIYSRENNNVVLTVTADGEEYTVYPVMDTYISFENKNTNYGTDGYMYIAERLGDTGILANGTMRAYIRFDLSDFKDKSITMAKMRLRGRTPVGSSAAKATVWLLSDSSWNETGLCWSNTMQSVLCFNGADGIPWEKFTSENLNNEYISGISSWWERMYWMTGLANNYAKSKNEQYAQAAIDMLMDYIDYEFENSVGSGGGLSTAIRARELSKSHHHLALSDYMTPEKNIKYIKYMYELGRYLESNSNFRPNHNWGTFQILGLNHTASYFCELERSSLWRELAIRRVGILLENIIASDGSYVEGSSHYSYEALTQIMKVIKDVEAAGNKLTAEVIENLRRCTEYALNISFPNGYDIAYGDGSYGKINISSAVNYLGDENLTYISTGGTSGEKPEYTSKIYPDGRNKMAILRSGFTKSDLAMYINNGGANRLSHTHPDDLAVIAYAYNNPVLIDPGSFSYDVTTQSEWQRHTTEAHNTVTVDSSPQPLADGNISDWSTTEAFDYYEGVSGAYEGFTHSRRIYFIKDKLWLVADDIKASDTASHTYEQNWHFPTWATPSLDKSTGTVTTVSPDNANISVVQLDGSDMTVSMKNGWYHDEAGKLAEGEFASYKKSSASGAKFLTLLYPHRANDTKNVTVTQLAASSENAKAYSISDGVTNDTIIINNGENAVTAGDLTFKGEFLYVRKNTDGKIIKISALNATSLVSGGKKVFESSECEKNITISVTDSVMTVDTESTNLLDNAELYHDGALDKLIYNNAETDFAVLGNKIVPGKVFSWNINNEEGATLKTGRLSASAVHYGFNGEDVRFYVGIFDGEGRLISLGKGEDDGEKYTYTADISDMASKAVLMLIDSSYLSPVTKAEVITNNMS